MAPIEPMLGRNEPQTAADYEERTARAVRAVLIEIAQILGSFRGRFVIVGGAVPWLLLDNEAMRHVGIGTGSVDPLREAGRPQTSTRQQGVGRPNTS